MNEKTKVTFTFEFEGDRPYWLCVYNLQKAIEHCKPTMRGLNITELEEELL